MKGIHSSEPGRGRHMHRSRSASPSVVTDFWGMHGGIRSSSGKDVVGVFLFHLAALTSNFRVCCDHLKELGSSFTNCTTAVPVGFG